MAVPRTIAALALSVLAYNIRSATAQSPVELQWSSISYGPDGPWNVIELELGRSPAGSQPMSFFPGAGFQTSVPTTSLCTQNRTTQCFAPYDQRASTDGAGNSNDVAFRPDAHHYALGLKAVGRPMRMWVDDVDFLQGAPPVSNLSLGLMDHVFLEYPNGEWYPPIAGCLAVGGAAVNQSFELPDGPPVNASLAPGYLWEHGDTASNSFTMHIGSVSPPVAGSLYFGGYDRRRALGDVLGLPGSSYRTELDLVDISIKVFQGESPFDFAEEKTGLLAAGNSSLDGGVKVRMDGCSPYLTLPESTCKSLASHLPISYNSGLGLYIWDTDDARYSQILNSASGLTFTLTGDTTVDDVTISVPFQHLNLTLTEPLVRRPTVYFPCSTTRVNDYVLGRAFLQDAFVGANWNKGRFWLGQAPGPGGVQAKNVVQIGDSDITIEGTDGSWESTWTEYWGRLEKQGGGGRGGSGARDETSEGGASPSGLSVGAKAGIGVGASAVVLGLVALLVFLLRRKKQRDTRPEVAQQQHFPRYDFRSGPDVAQSRVIPELSSQQTVYEMGMDGMWKNPAEATWNHPVEVPASPIRQTWGR